MTWTPRPSRISHLNHRTREQFLQKQGCPQTNSRICLILLDFDVVLSPSHKRLSSESLALPDRVEEGVVRLGADQTVAAAKAEDRLTQLILSPTSLAPGPEGSPGSHGVEVTVDSLQQLLVLHPVPETRSRCPSPKLFLHLDIGRLVQQNNRKLPSGAMISTHLVQRLRNRM
jgi:hypothetical protein